jgi:hypothetical protein
MSSLYTTDGLNTKLAEDIQILSEKIASNEINNRKNDHRIHLLGTLSYVDVDYILAKTANDNYIRTKDIFQAIQEVINNNSLTEEQKIISIVEISSLNTKLAEDIQILSENIASIFTTLEKQKNLTVIIPHYRNATQ